MKTLMYFEGCPKQLGCTVSLSSITTATVIRELLSYYVLNRHLTTRAYINVDQVKFNSVLAVKANETTPVDGIVVEGECHVDEKTLIDDSFPVSKQKDSMVWVDSTNLNGYISVKTTALAEDFAVARMAKLVEDAQIKKSKTQIYIGKYAKYYTGLVNLKFYHIES